MAKVNKVEPVINLNIEVRPTTPLQKAAWRRFWQTQIALAKKGDAK